MKIKKRLQLNAWFVLIIISIMLVPVVWSIREASNADRNRDLVIEMQRIAYERAELEEEYLLRQETRAGTQWEAKNDDFRRLLKEVQKSLTTIRDRSIIEEVQKSFEINIFLFSKIMEYRGGKYTHNKDTLTPEEEKRLISKIIVSTYDLNTSINNLRKSASREKDADKNTAILFLLCFMGLAVIVTAGNSVLIARILASRVAVLHKGSEIFGSGDLNHRIPITGNDEFADLATANNEMAARLKNSYTSIENLNAEIVERVKTENALREQKETLSSFLDAVHESMVMIDTQGTVILSNVVGAERLGATVPDLAGKRLYDYFPPDTAALRKKHYDRVVATGQPVYFEDTRLQRSFEQYCYPLFDKEGRVSGVTIFAREVTSQKRAENALRQSEAKYRSIFENAVEGIFQSTPDGRFLDVNPALACMYGYDLPKDVVAGISSIAQQVYVRPELRQVFAQELEEKGVINNFEAQLYRKDGSTLWISTNARAVRDADGRTLYYEGTSVDITERKRIENELATSKNFLEEIMDLSPFAMWVSDAQGTLLRLNKALRETLKVTDEQIVGRYNVFEDQNLIEQGVMPQIKAVFNEGIPARFSIPWQASKGGEADFTGAKDLYIDVAMFPTKDHQGKVVNVVCQWVDITERKQAEQRRELTNTILEALNSPSEIINLIRHILLLIENYTGIEAIGIRLKEGEDYPYYEFSGFPEDFIEAERYLCARDNNGVIIRDSKGNPCLECMCGNIICGRTNPSLPFFTEGGSFWTNNTSKLLASTSEEDRQARTRNRCNGAGYESVALIPLRSEEETIGLLQLNDKRTDRFTLDAIKFLEEIGAAIGIAISHKKAEEEILALNAELEERIHQRTSQLEAKNKELETFTYSVSHDLKAPLRAVEGFTHILVEDYGAKLDAEGRRICSVVEENARYMGTLIEDLLLLSRAGRAELRLMSIDMEALSQSIFFELTTPEERERIDLHVGALPQGVGDITLIKQVWTNIIGNAVKFSSKRERAAIEIEGAEGKEEVVYSVKDNGVGFDMRYVDKIFGLFQRLHGKEEFGGTGVGLAIVEHIIKRHGGRVWAEGEKGKGAQFWFSLPKTDNQSPNSSRR